MAARTRKINIGEAWREKIRVGVLINLLEKHALGENQLGPTQIRAIEILLKKIAPDLLAVEHSGEVEHTYVARVPNTIPEADEWAKQHVPPALQ